MIGTNFPLSTEYSDRLREQIQDGLNPFDAVAEAELDYIEFAIKNELFDGAALWQDVRAAQARGLKVNLHPYFNCTGFGTPDESPQLKIAIKSCLEMAEAIAQQQGGRLVMNFHAASARPEVDRYELIEQSVAFFQWMLPLAEATQITVEHQLPPYPKQKKQRIGDSFDELLALRDQVGAARLGFCWDMGHSMMRTVYQRSNPIPSIDFVNQVRHVHIHDVDLETRSDHRLIGSGGSPLGQFIRMLQAVHYQGDFTMEYSADEFFKTGYVTFLKSSRAALLKLIEENNP